MRICVDCGVELEEDDQRCPLCGRPVSGEAPVGESSSARSATSPVPIRDAADTSSSPCSEATRRVRRWVLEVIVLVGGTAALIVFAADFAYGMAVTWARIPLAAIGFLTVSGLLIVSLGSNAFLFVPLETVALALLLLLVDSLTPGSRWYFPVALPIVLLTGSLLVGALALGQKLRLSPLAAIALGVFAAGLLAQGVELAVNRFLTGVYFVSWSFVAFACVLPLVLLLLSVRRWVRKHRPEIEKLFHM
jgi:hypothetical protein